MTRPACYGVLLLAALVFPACGDAEARTEPVVTRVAFGSCAFQWEAQPIWKAVVAAEPDLYLSLGDAIYGDFDGQTTFDVTEASLRAEWAKLGANEKGMDEWGGYPRGRRRLFDLIAETEAKGVILLSGNAHFAEISTTDEGPYLLVDFTSSGLTHVNETYPEAPNRYRVAGPFVEFNFGLVEIDWDASEGPVVTLTAIGVDGRRGLVHSVSLASLASLAPPAVTERPPR